MTKMTKMKNEAVNTNAISFLDLIVDPTFKTSDFSEQIEKASKALQGGQFDECQKHLETADLIDICIAHIGVAQVMISHVSRNQWAKGS